MALGGASLNPEVPAFAFLRGYSWLNRFRTLPRVERAFRGVASPTIVRRSLFGGAIDLDVSRRGHPAEDLVKHRLRHRLHVDLVLNAPEKRFIGKIVGVEVGREHHHQLEGNLELDPVPQ